jgi:predicted metal-dependent enzyme (double-stranded beta helix superfamily)
MGEIGVLDGRQLSDLVQGLAARPALWRPHVRAEPGRRHFHRLVDEDHASVWLITWMPGTDTGFHDHDGAAGAVAVVQGRVCEERLRLGGTPLRGVAGPGEAFRFGPHDIHRVTHVEGEPAVTIHAYSPRLRRMGRYVEGAGGVLMREALDEDTELRPDEAAATALGVAGT